MKWIFISFFTLNLTTYAQNLEILVHDSPEDLKIGFLKFQGSTLRNTSIGIIKKKVSPTEIAEKLQREKSLRHFYYYGSKIANTEIVMFASHQPFDQRFNPLGKMLYGLGLSVYIFK